MRNELTAYPSLSDVGAPAVPSKYTLALWLSVAFTDERNQWVRWSDATTPRTDKPVRFSKGQHYVYRGGSIARVARMGTSSRIA